MDDGGSATSPTHSAFVYDEARDYAAFLVPFICAALERDEFVAVATASRRIGLLRRALGPDAPRVHFLADTDWYVRPVRTIAGWAHLLRTHPGAHLINEIPDPTDVWIRYESALTAALAGQDGGHVLCPHPRDQERMARRTHHIVYDHGWHHSDDFVPPERLLPTLPEPEYPIDGPPVVAVPVNDTVADLRALVRTRAAEGGWLTPERVETLVLTLSELATNAIRYGGDRRDLRLWLTPEAVVGEITDDGADPPGPLAGYLPPRPGETGGMGLWLVAQVCDAFALRADAGRTRARFAILR